ncbi:MAG: protein-tyrosine-phosphatase [Streptosporangiales bacterium]|nr:protein-tyrosine-phosphatase [Streptosporangiales bacterium]
MRLDWPACANARDLGDLPSGDGRRIRPGVLIRSDRLGQLTEAGLATARACGLSLVLDLRSEAECTNQPTPFAAEAFYRNLPVQDPAVRYTGEGTLADLYLAMLDRRPEWFAAALAAIADAPDGAVVVHCHAGKDRTGLVVALALTLAGVDRDVITEDYVYSDVGLREVNEAIYTGIADPAERQRLRHLWAARPETIAAALDHLDRRYGGAEGYLRAGGFTDANVEAVRRRLLG